MKKTIMSLAVVSALMSGAAFAADPAGPSEVAPSKATLNFIGSVTSSLCQVKTEDAQGKDIILGELSKSSLATTGKGPAQSFEVRLVNCDSTTNNISYTLADANHNPGNGAALGYLVPKSYAGAAEGVGVYVLTSTGSQVTLGTEQPLKVEMADTDKAQPEQVIPLSAYIGTKTGTKDDTNSVKAGSVEATGVLTIKATNV